MVVRNKCPCSSGAERFLGTEKVEGANPSMGFHSVQAEVVRRISHKDVASGATPEHAKHVGMRAGRTATVSLTITHGRVL